jgi:pimeloyl-ACP methyl ester carboxylesterase
MSAGSTIVGSDNNRLSSHFESIEGIGEKKTMSRSANVGVFLLAVLLVGLGASLSASAQPLPVTDPGGPPNIWYGGVSQLGAAGPVLVFVHGLGSNATYYWTLGNDIYVRAYNLGYRTAYISFNADNSNNADPIAVNGQKLRTMLPIITARFNVPQVYLICMSKGGLDAQWAMLDQATRNLVKGVFTLASPNQGAQIADWAFGPGQNIAGALGLLTPGLWDLRPAYVQSLRAQMDPIFAKAGIPFFTACGKEITGSAVTTVTGIILKNLSGEQNDGLVTMSEARLTNPSLYSGPSAYAMDTGAVPANHFQMGLGEKVFSYVHGHIQGLEMMISGWKKIGTNGIGTTNDARFNTWLWSQRWYKGKLYIGFGRSVECMIYATSDAQQGTSVYPPPDAECTPDMKDLALRSEIYRYTPETQTFELVYKSPADINIGTNQNGQQVYTARDAGYRDMFVVDEPGGVQALYVAGVSAGSLFNKLPQWPNKTYPPPRILRTVDGVNFAPLPQDPGTFLGDICKNNTDISVVSFRSFMNYNGRLYVNATNLRGEGFVIESAEPWKGNNAWRRVSPDASLVRIWDIQTFNNWLYAATGNREGNEGYGVFKTNAQGWDPVKQSYAWIPVIQYGAWQSNPDYRSPVGLTLAVFQNMLYVGTDRRTEMVRIRGDDTWDLVAGEPRNTPVGMKYPISGIGQYFGNYFNGHFWQMKESSTGLHMGTWDWSVGLTRTPFNQFINSNYGFDLLRTKDGVYWTLVSYQGMGDGINFGGRSMELTPFGLTLGTARPDGGAQLWLESSALDFNKDGVIDQQDANLLTAANGQRLLSPTDHRDIDRDGKITVLDVRKLVTQCTFPGCAVPPASVRARFKPAIATPLQLVAATQGQVGRNASLTWQPVPGATRYRVYRIPVKAISDFIPSGITMTIPGTNLTVNLPQDAQSGKLDFLCPKSPYCKVVELLKAKPSSGIESAGFPGLVELVSTTTATQYQEVSPTVFQSLYFVRAEDAFGNLSEPSNYVGAPSKVGP